MKKSVWLVLLLLMGDISAKQAEPQNNQKEASSFVYSRPLFLSVAFYDVNELLDRKLASDVNVALEKASSWVFDKGNQWLQPNRVWTRVAYKYFLYPVAMGPFYKSLRATQDAHARRESLASLRNLKPQYLGNTFETYAENYWTLLLRNIWSSYKSAVSGSSMMTVSVADSDKDLSAVRQAIEAERLDDAVDANSVLFNQRVVDLRNELERDLSKGQRLNFRSAGYNARMMHTRNVEDTLWYDRGGHLAQLSNHTANKLTHTIDAIGVFFMRNESGQLNSELGRIQSAYKDMGIELSWQEMGAYGAMAFLGSAEFWGRFFEEVDYVATGDVFVKAPERGGFRLPNLGFYLTSKGPSYQINTGYRYGESLFFPVAVEFVFKGKKTAELTLGVRKYFNWMNSYLHAEVVSNLNEFEFGGKLGFGMKPKNTYLVDLGVRFDNGKTLQGERTMWKKLIDFDFGFYLFAKVGVLF